MNIVGARIDGWLIHGQVANLWTPKLQTDHIMVVDKDTARSNIRKSDLRMATPLMTRLNVLPAQAAVDRLIHKRYGNQRIFIVAKKPATSLDLLNLGSKPNTLDVGAMS